MDFQKEAKEHEANGKRIVDAWTATVNDPVASLIPVTFADYMSVESILPVDPFVREFKCLNAQQNDILIGSASNFNRHERIWWSDLWDRVNDPDTYFEEDPLELNKNGLERFEQEIIATCSGGCYYDW